MTLIIFTDDVSSQKSVFSHHFKLYFTFFFTVNRGEQTIIPFNNVKGYHNYVDKLLRCFGIRKRFDL